MTIVDDIFKDLNKDISWLKDRTVYLTVHGSVAYGLNTPESDVDIRGITIPPKEYFLGFNKRFDEHIKKDPDSTIFSIRKFFSLASAGNPNCLELLFTNPKHHIFVSDIGKVLIENRKAFLSKALKERYLGFAKSQAHRIKNHKEWCTYGEDAHAPTREEMGLPVKPLIDENQFDAVKALIKRKMETWIPDFEPFSDSQKIYLNGKVADILTEMTITVDDRWLAAARTIGLNDNLIDVIKREKEYENKLEDWKSYLRWKKDRNPKRAAMEAKFGYDGKHAMHLVRLLRMGTEILETGELEVERTKDREELLGIKNGSMSFDGLVVYADKMEDDVKVAYKNSKLPNQPNINYLDKLCIELIEKMNG